MGLCYSVGFANYPQAYPHFTVADLYGFMSPENIDLFMEESEKVLDDILKNGLSDNIFECAKNDCLASVLRVTETSEGSAHYLIKKYLLGKKGYLEDAIDKIKSVKKKTCNELAEKLLSQQRNWAVMVPKI